MESQSCLVSITAVNRQQTICLAPVEPYSNRFGGICVWTHHAPSPFHFFLYLFLIFLIPISQHDDLQMHMAAKAGFFDPRIIPEHQPLPAYNPTIQTTYQQPASLPHSIVSEAKSARSTLINIAMKNLYRSYFLYELFSFSFNYRIGDEATTTVI